MGTTQIHSSITFHAESSHSHNTLKKMQQNPILCQNKLFNICVILNKDGLRAV